MYFDFGLISANNGWAMAITGAIIVILGLSILSFIISQLHKVIMLFEKKQFGTGQQKKMSLPANQFDANMGLQTDLEATAKIYKVISKDLGSMFELSKLYQLTQREQMPHPHITIRSLREAGFLVPLDDGIFTWKNN
ncbi:MAG: OadG family protein [Proteobacteria bacterium]|nr:OadG family protein [Pseudomonadota bacterium]